MYYLGWLVGAIVVLYLGNMVLDYVKEEANRTFIITYQLWGTFVIYFIYGVYLGLLNGLPKRFSLNRPLFIFVCIPCLILLFYSIAIFYFRLPFFEMYRSLVKDNNSQLLFTIVAGMTLILSLFSPTKHSE